MGMFNLLENDIEQVAQLATFSEALLDYHQQSTEILKELCDKLIEKKNEAANRPKLEFIPKTLADLTMDMLTAVDSMNGSSRAGSPTSDEKPTQLVLFTAANLSHSADEVHGEPVQAEATEVLETIRTRGRLSDSRGGL
ncbi:endophilin-A3-like [Copidosoma floridanum]|uniref:endophilin-A3-like n=1 Tax=Copidosoma floridanum TaxID=29053 RepID=UPI0006C94B93|nr:endophilin-A3-like [Copidosoma floridanum]